jgi:hypothetical protein
MQRSEVAPLKKFPTICSSRGISGVDARPALLA